MGRLTDTTITDEKIAKEIGLSAAEFAYVCKELGRRPSYAELGVFSAMFSEHCSYKSSKKYLKRLPTEGGSVLQGPGENAGIVDIGEGYAVAFKMESHNHPSYIEPYQGAATGVGGILRDIFTMGARPIASMDSLCFGATDHKKTPQLVKGVVKGIGDYGNSVGVPTVAGQTFFHSCYNGNILVNAFTLGLVKHEGIFRASASGAGNIVVYVGAKTGRDGVHGATMASQEFSTDKEPERPTVQVGDPFTEKLLIEASLEAMRAGLIIGIQDMGAAGLTSSSFEMAYRGKSGLEIDLDKIPARETGMSAYELLLSESQERMLLVTSEDRLPPLREIFEKWDLHAEAIGYVVEGNTVRMTRHGQVVVELPVALVNDPPRADRPTQVPVDLKQRWFFDRNRLFAAPLEQKIQTAVDNPNFADARPIVEQYDSMVGNRTQGGTYDDAAVLRLREIDSKSLRLAMTVDCNPRVCWLNPREGGRRAVAEAAINLATRGAKAIGLTDCLNFGNPENPEVMWQFEEAVEGIRETCLALHVPVISGNVSFYNDTDGKPIFPTPMIGMVGLIEGKAAVPYAHLFSTELELALVGQMEGGLGGSAFASLWFKRECGKPEDTDLAVVQRAIKFCHALPEKRIEAAVHDISDGGLLVAALEMAFRGSLPEAGLRLQFAPGSSLDDILFGESVPRLLLAYESSARVELQSLAARHALPFTVIGSCTDRGKLELLQGGAPLFATELAPIRSRWRDRWRPLFD